MKIKGAVINKEGKGEVGAKVFVSDSQGKITLKKIGTTTDENGQFQLDVTGKDGNYLTAKAVTGDITLTPLNDAVTDYKLDLRESKVTTTPDVVVKPKKQDIKEEPKEQPKSPIDWALIGLAGIGVLLLVIGGITAFSGAKK